MKFNLPITFDSDARTFEGINHKYKILESLPVCRYKEVGLIEVELAFGADTKTISNYAADVYTSINSNSNMAGMAVNSYKLIESLKSLEGRTPTVLKLIDIYTVKEGQDLKEFGGAHLQDKINDWANIDVNFFFQLSIRLIPNYLNSYKLLSESISK